MGDLVGLSILLVEDETSVRKLVRKLLELLGCTVTEVASGREALERWPEIRHSISLVVSDIVMPGGISGWDLARELHQRHPTLPILMTSGYCDFSEEHEFAGHPRVAFLQKPYQIRALRDNLRLLMETSGNAA